MKNVKFFGVSLIIFAALVIFASGCSGFRPAATVNGEVITYKQLDKELEKRFGKRVIEDLVLEKLIFQKAKKENISVSSQELDESINELKKNPQFETMLKFQNLTIEDVKEREKVFMTLQKLITKNVTGEEKKKFFEKNKMSLEKVKASHILIDEKNKQKAEEVLKEVKSGKNFAELAKKYSIDPRSKDNGGDLGYFTRTDMVAEFSKAAFELKPGEISGLVKTGFGYHIIKVEDKFDTYDKLSRDVEKAMVDRQKMGDCVQDLRNKAKIKIYLDGDEKKEKKEKEKK